jgi:hypothetical protein
MRIRRGDILAGGSESFSSANLKALATMHEGSQAKHIEHRDDDSSDRKNYFEN